MSSSQTLEGLEAGEHTGTQTLKISSGITTIPHSLFSLHSTLTHLDLSNNHSLSTLPASFSRLHNLKIAFFSNCSFTTFPKELASCRSLEMVAFKSNRMTSIPEDSLPLRLRWLILTGNELAELPRSIGKCARLEKCMLAGNKLRALPEEMRMCRHLTLLRLSCNAFEGLPGWLWELPELAFFSWAGNPCAVRVGGGVVVGEKGKGELEEIKWGDLAVHEILGKGASGIISKGTRKKPTAAPYLSTTLNRRSAEAKTNGQVRGPEEVAIKIFHGTLTSDGSPLSEMSACIAAGQHDNLISTLGTIISHPENDSGLVLELVPKHYTNLGLPPSFATCTRDTFSPAIAGSLSLQTCRRILEGMANAARHLHARGVCHGDLYAHNILVDLDRGHAMLGDFGAGTIYGGGVGGGGRAERVEVRAFGHLMEDLVGCVRWGDGEGEEVYLEGLIGLWRRCIDPVVGGRPRFQDIVVLLEELRGQQ